MTKFVSGCISPYQVTSSIAEPQVFQQSSHGSHPVSPSVANYGAHLCTPCFSCFGLIHTDSVIFLSPRLQSNTGHAGLNKKSSMIHLGFYFYQEITRQGQDVLTACMSAKLSLSTGECGIY